jgi:molybdopterin synthase sulfur carrier subunit
VSEPGAVVRVRLFAAAREAAGTAELVVDPQPLGMLLDALRRELGGGFSDVLDRARVWVNGDDPSRGDDTPLTPGDEVAVLPPVSGGSVRPRTPR